MSSFHKQSQSAMEFLMTYGWAFLIVLIVIFSLIYFGILDPSRWLPEKVDLQEGVDIVDASADLNSISFILRNTLGRDIHDFQINATECNDGNGTLSTAVDIPEGKTKKITIYCEHDYVVGSKIDSGLEALWKTRTSTKGERYDFDQKTRGSMKVTVNEGKELYDQVEIDACGTLNLTRTIYYLTDNINQTSDANCLLVSDSNVILDCDGYFIASNYNKAGFYSDQDNITVRNCNISMGPDYPAFGLSFDNNDNVLIQNNTFHNQARGIQISSVLAENITITNNTFSNNTYGLFVQYAGSNVTANIFSGSYIALYFNIGALNYAYNNTVTNSSVGFLVFSSDNNTFRNNTIIDSLSGVSIVSTGSYSASNNLFVNMNLSNLTGTSVDLTSVGSLGNYNNTFLNSSYNNESVSSSSQLIREWYYKAYVNDSDGNAVSGAYVTGYNVSGDLIFNVTTGADGWIPNAEIIEYANNSGTVSYYSNYTINVTKWGIVNTSISYNVSALGNKFDNNLVINNLWCYQESANLTTSCGGFDNGSYSCGGVWDTTNTCNYTKDGNWSSWATHYGATGLGTLRVNYTKPIGVDANSLWQVRTQGEWSNFSLPSPCWNQDPLQLHYETDGYENWGIFKCYNGTAWHQLSIDWDIFYEEAMWWYIP